MKKLLISILLCISFNHIYSSEIKVYNANQFVDAIGSNVTLLLMDSIILSEIDEDKSGSNYRMQEAHDGRELVITNVENLNIIGSTEYPTDIITDPRYGFVLIFENCSKILIDNINAGHTDPGYCEGGVFSFLDCQNITIDNSIMFGSGTTGIWAVNVKNLKCNNSLIWGCTYDIMSLKNCMYFQFNNCEFSSNRGFDMIYIKNSIKIEFNDCIVKNNNTNFGCGSNYGELSLLDISESISIVLNNCVIENNTMCYFTKNKSDLTLNNTIFQNNNFGLGVYKD